MPVKIVGHPLFLNIKSMFSSRLFLRSDLLHEINSIHSAGRLQTWDCREVSHSDSALPSLVSPLSSPRPAAAYQPSHQAALVLLGRRRPGAHRSVHPGLGGHELQVAEELRVLRVGDVEVPGPAPALPHGGHVAVAAGGGHLAPGGPVRDGARV